MSSNEGPRNRRFQEQVLPYQAAAYNLARWMSRNDTDAGDIVQEALVRALKYFDGYRGGDARSWLLRIVRNTAYTWLQSNSPALQPLSMADLGDLNDSGAADPARAIAAQDEARRLRFAINQLPIECREVLVLRELEELSYRQIAQIVDCPIGTVMSRLSRARDKLSTELLSEAKCT